MVGAVCRLAGGLGVWGGIALGCLAGAWIIHRSGQSVRLFMDAVAPGLLLAQGIGRWGNWFNQELFGKPTKLPWGLEIDPAHRPAGYFDHSTFHPTFLYEFVYDLVGVGILLAIDKYFRIRRPALFALYVSYYCFGRFFEELLRIDPAHKYFGLRLNAYVSIVLFVLSILFFIWWQFIRPEGGSDRPRASRVLPKGPTMAVPKGRVRSRSLGSDPMLVVRELDLDLDAFEGPFDLLLTLVLKEELDLADVDVAGIVLHFVERLAEREQLDLDVCGEFLVLVSALLELKARGLFEEEAAELADLEPEEAAEELARRLAEYRRMKEAAAWLSDRLAPSATASSGSGRRPSRRSRSGSLPRRTLRSLPRSSAPGCRASVGVARAHGAPLPTGCAVSGALPRSLQRRSRFDFDSEVEGLSRAEQAVAFLALLDLRRSNQISISQAAPFAPIRVTRVEEETAATDERTPAWTARSA